MAREASPKQVEDERQDPDDDQDGRRQDDQDPRVGIVVVVHLPQAETMNPKRASRMPTEAPSQAQDGAHGN